MKSTLRTPHSALRILTAFCLLHCAFSLPLFAQGTAFTYQGQLRDGGAAADGIYDLRFTIYDAGSDGNVVGGPLTNSPVAVGDGLFTVTLDFGPGVFNGAERWLEIAVRTNGGGGYTALAPLQALTATPYAITAGNVTGVVDAAQLTGTVPDSVLSANVSLLGDTIEASEVDAASFNITFWRTEGNAGTAPGTHFVGTADDQPLEVRVNNQRALRLEPAPETPNVLGGNAANSAAPDVRGATIAGGGLPLFPNQVTANFATVGGGTFHIAGGVWSTVAGGRDNRAYAESSAVSGGHANVIETDAIYSVIGGGLNNAATTGFRAVTVGGGENNRGAANHATVGGGLNNSINSSRATIGGGSGNIISNNAFNATVGGGVGNRIATGADSATIGGGNNNVAAGVDVVVAGGNFNQGGGQRAAIGGGFQNVTLANYAAVGGGFNNQIQANAWHGTISGGANNTIETDTTDATIAGGFNNRIQGLAHNSVIGGGWTNTIGFDARYAAIGGGEGIQIKGGASRATVAGGFYNAVEANATFATLAGGRENVAGASEATVAGGAFNHARGFSSTIGGGGGNVITSSWSVVSGGRENAVQTGATFATIGGGYLHRILTNAESATIGGGRQNLAAGESATIGGGNGNSVIGSRSTIGGGASNIIETNAATATIAGGWQNRISEEASHGVIGGGRANWLGTNSYASTIAGGEQNVVPAQVRWSAIGGGGQNQIEGFGWGTIAGGRSNRIATLSAYSTIGGGQGNTTDATGSTVSGGQGNAATGGWGTVPGGRDNAATTYAFAAGHRAKANHSGSFVWADDTDADFASTANSQFLIRANGFVGINKNDPATALDVNGTVTAGSFSGLGSGLTELSASQLTSGTLPSGRFSGTYSSAVTLNNAANSFTGSGANLTALNASQLTSGTLPDARLSGNVARRDLANTFTAAQTIQSPSSGLSPAALRVAPTTANAVGLYVFQTSSDAALVVENRGTGVNSDQIKAFNGPGNQVFRVDNDGDVFAKSFTPSSDRHRKENFAPVCPQEMLAKVTALPITRWNFKGDAATPHVGPMAQDFHAAFGLGANDTTIATVDADGVALAAIQGLNQRLTEELKRRDVENAELKARLETLERLMKQKTGGAQ